MTQTTKLQSEIEKYRALGYGIYRRILGNGDVDQINRLKSEHPLIPYLYSNTVDGSSVMNAIQELRNSHGPMVAILDITVVDGSSLESVIMYNRSLKSGYSHVSI